MSVFFGAFNKSISVEIESKVPKAWAKKTYPPNDQQAALIDFAVSGEGSCNLIACAGTGKTTTLLWVLPYIAEGPADVTVSTMHAAGLRGFTNGNRRTKIDGSKLNKMLDELSSNNDVYVKYFTFLRKLVSFAKQSGFGVATSAFPAIEDCDAWQEIIEYYSLEDDLPETGNLLNSDLIRVAQDIYRQSLTYCQKPGGPFTSPTVDFDDMLLAPLYFNSKLQHYDWVLLDEAQDTNAVRRELAIRMMRPKTGRLLAVGDPNQAIYGFTGADSDAMDIIKQRLGSAELPLTVTYRCPKSVVQLAQCWVPQITAHETAPDGSVTEVWLKPEGDSQMDFWKCGPFTASDAVLCRNTKPLVELAYAMLRKRIPCMIEGRDIGQSIIKLCQKWKVSELSALETRLTDYREREAAKWRAKRNDRKAEEVEDKVDTIMVLMEAVRADGKRNVRDLVDLVNSMFGDTPPGERPKCITLSTVHKSKGREWPRVFILGRNRFMPSKYAKKDWELRQERNLMYVAVTRSMDKLIDIHVPTK